VSEVKAYSVATLAERWDCHQDVVRRLIAKGALQSFRVGALIRVSATEVERYECNGSALPDTGADTSLSITMVKDGTAARSTREMWRQRTLKPVT
jgi:excisionase family DNA binding protein